ncbi:hypothetical protein F7R13_01925 [Burkholderia territorii]|uniref:Uncharacterized protein n=1 Tax=Burkholderia territorii TaxID=1503055 RepID=A0A6L3NP67_9BURK|nr:hypothetical protein F7R13_01925 [Burkholderia territorii]
MSWSDNNSLTAHFNPFPQFPEASHRAFVRVRTAFPRRFAAGPLCETSTQRQRQASIATAVRASRGLSRRHEPPGHERPRPGQSCIQAPPVSSPDATNYGCFARLIDPSKPRERRDNIREFPAVGADTPACPRPPFKRPAPPASRHGRRLPHA